MIKAKSFSTGTGRGPTDRDKFLYNFHGGRVEAGHSREIQNAKRRLATLLDNPIARPVHRWHIKPDFSPETSTSQDVISLLNVSKAFEARVLLADVTATITNGERVVMSSPNGTGKTTLLKMILGLQQPDSGMIRIAPRAKLGYLDQEQETLNPGQTVLEAFSQNLIGSEDEHRAALHKYGLFSADQVLQPIANLSIGQQRKLQIARLIAQKANVLLLDEPTNHLDLESVDQFERALCDFPGTVLAISHDRYFIERVAMTVWSIENHALVVERMQQV